MERCVLKPNIYLLEYCFSSTHFGLDLGRPSRRKTKGPEKQTGEKESVWALNGMKKSERKKATVKTVAVV